MNFIKTMSLAAFLASMTGSAAGAQGTAGKSATTVTADSFALSARLPTDAAVRIGTLPNGIRYYIRRNAKPEQRAELRLVVNAGSILEDDDQRGLALFIELMAFIGT